ncbi:hypothetical protein P8935_12840 [Telmatobacter sp. DSM 110680]|uniref:Uncharacterized protein n=1 Tax=Telmatobacter sp. DSM 110680 TaxID=3036704 RepID=A0AAU7DEF0_9BACT
MEDQALKWWHVRWGLAGRIISRFAIVSGKLIGLLFLVGAVGWGVLYLLQPWLSSQHLGKIDPQLSIIPVSISNKAESPLSNSNIEHYGFIFRLPNKGIARTIEQTTLVRFPNGMLEFPRPERYEDSLVFASTHNDEHVEKLLGREMLHSQFKLMQVAMLATPEQVKWWRFRSSQNERASLLLVLKFIALTESSPVHALTIRPVYTISSGEFHGFQVGNPDVPPYEARIDLYDGADRHLAFDIWGGEGHGQVLTQEEINAMVASIRPASDH